MNEGWYDKIERFLRGDMNPEEEHRFREELVRNEELSSTYRVYKTVDEQMQSKERKDEQETALKVSLDALTKKHFASGTGGSLSVAGGYRIRKSESGTGKNAVPEIRRVWKEFAIAAAVLGVILVSALWMMNRDMGTQQDDRIAQNKTQTDTSRENVIQSGKDTVRTAAEKNNQSNNSARTPSSRETGRQLLARYFEADTLPAKIAGPLQKAMQLYEEEQYAGAIEFFRQVDLDAVTRGESAEKKVHEFYSDYYLGQSYLATNQPAKAVASLKEALDASPDEAFQHKVAWYLSLAYLGTGDIQHAKDQLRQLSSQSTSTHLKTSVESLLKELGK